MKFLQIFQFLFYLCCFSPILVARFSLAENFVENFAVEIIIHKDGRLIITEQIDFNHNIKKQSLGIMRQFPKFIWLSPSKQKELVYQVNWLQRNGRPQDYFTQVLDSRFAIFFNKNTMKLAQGEDIPYIKPGTHRYLLQYEVKNALKPMLTQERLIWNVTSNHFLIPIHSVVVSVKIPIGISRSAVLNSLKNSYTGSSSDKSQNYLYTVEKDASLKLWTTEKLEPEKAFVIQIDLPKGYIKNSD